MQDAKNHSAPAIDAVRVWVTFTIERDYIERGVFPHVRAPKATVQHGSSSLHYMTAEAVKPILADAKSRADETRKGLRNAYNSFVRGLEDAIKEASGRRAIFEAPEAVCTYKHDGYSEHWRGTKAQLQAMGIALAGPWPGEEGGRLRWAKTTDANGRDAFITEYSKTWHGLYEARIEIPVHERKRGMSDNERAEKRRDAEYSLRDMPADEDGFRQKIVDDVRRWLAISVKAEESKYHGFSLTEEAVEEILMSCDAVVEAVLEAEVKFDEKRHREIEQKYRQQIAETDESFQQMLGGLTTVWPEIIEGSPT